MRALLVERLPHRFAAARIASGLGASNRAIGLGPLRLAEIDPPELPGPQWHRVRPLLSGICGSDLHTVNGESSRYFESIVSFPFVLGHEIVGEIADGERSGARVVIEPVLGCAARGIDPPCRSCASGAKDACEHLAFGSVSPGLQIGFCADTGGGFSDELVVHASQLHEVPGSMSDEDAVLVEPTACAIHAVLRAGVGAEENVVVLGAGTLGLLTVSALRRFSPPKNLLVSARHTGQRRLAERLGADRACSDGDLVAAARRQSSSLGLSGNPSPSRLSGGCEVVFDCVGSSASLAQALSIVRPRGRIVLVGMPGSLRIDLAPLWQREVSLVGAYAYGTEHLEGSSTSTFRLALEHAEHAHLGELVSAHYPLERYEDAIGHAGAAGRRGATKIVFDLRRERAQWRRPKDPDTMSERNDA